MIRERDGRTLPFVFPAEEAAVPVIRQRVERGTVVHADESPAWNTLHAGFTMRRINHRDGYSIGGACTNGAESYFSRLRRGELGHHHHVAGPYLLRYVQEAAWREDAVASATVSRRTASCAWRCSPARRSISGYWQRAHA